MTMLRTEKGKFNLIVQNKTRQINLQIFEVMYPLNLPHKVCTPRVIFENVTIAISIKRKQITTYYLGRVLEDSKQEN